jgi:16S rRNA (uracil1498-N3)-methyltransferase
LSTLRARADAAAQVFVDDLSTAALDEQDRHHLVRVLRLRAGERVVACDGAGSWRLCALTDDGGLDPMSEVEIEPPPLEAVSVWLPALKGDRAEWAIAKLTELGVDEIGLLRCERASVRLDGPTIERVLSRWRRVAREAACQSRRTRLPAILGPLDVESAVGGGALRCDLEGEAHPASPRSLAVGPEGGWSEAERGSPELSFGLSDGVLRTETAAVVAGVVVTASRRGSPHAARAEAQ